MEVENTNSGFTIVETIVTLVIMSLFLTLLFQLFLSNERQRLEVAKRATAMDVAESNLSKVNSKSQLPASGTSTCSTANNNDIVSTPSSVTTIPASSQIATGSVTQSPLPSASTWQLYVVYPRSCDASLPVTIVSTVTYGSETVRRAKFVSN